MGQMLKKYEQKWGLIRSEKLVSTSTSDIFRTQSKCGSVILKILNEVGLKDELPGTYFLDNCAETYAVKLYEFDEQALLIEFLPGENLYQFSKVNNEKRASQIFCEIIKGIQSVVNIDHKHKLVNFTTFFEVLDQVAFPQGTADIADKAKYLAQTLVATQNREVLLHGDLHHENVISRASGEFACFDPKGLVGDPAYELGTTLKNPYRYPEISLSIEMFQERAKFFSRELGLPFNRIMGFAFVHLCLSTAWAIEDNVNYSHQLALAKKVSEIV